MNDGNDGRNRHILVIDDNQAIHDDFRKILGADGTGRDVVNEAEATLFGGASAMIHVDEFEIDSAYQGEEGLALVRKAIQMGRPYAMAFVDVRMPPGWDGVETVAHLWVEDPDLQVVLCTAYSDYSWEEMVAELGRTERLLILKKPFDNVEVCQLASALTDKWELARRARLKLNELEDMVAARTREIEERAGALCDMNEELSAARDAAESASQAKSDFLANMSHEIRTPMTAILGFTEQLLDPTMSESDRLIAVQTVRRSSEHLLQIINDVLDVSKIEAGKLKVEHIRGSPLQVVASVHSMMQVRGDAKGLPFNIEYIGAIPETIQTDPIRLRQILVNLVSNAIKFTETGGVRLLTRFVSADASGSRLAEPMMQFDVIDSGMGMTEEQAAKLFQPFVQADTSTTRRFGGTGLGLTISRRLAHLLGGDITFETKLGEGSAFRATIATGPLDDVEMIERPMDAAGAVAVTAEEAVNAASATRLDCRILLAEDGPDNQRLISFFLKKAGADVMVAENGKIASDKALTARDQGHPFDVILMDMQMPVMDGYTATSLLRRKGYTGVIIALTAHAMADDREKCIKSGCDDYATKPIDRAALIRQLVNWVENAPSERESKTAGAAP